MDVRGKKKAALIKTAATFRSLLLCPCIVFVGHIKSLDDATVLQKSHNKMCRFKYFY